MSLIKEPLIHFLAFGGFIFMLYGGLQSDTSDNIIHVDKGTVQYLQTNYQKIWNVAPSKAELEALISEYALDEIYYRQAKALGIDQQDPLIRKRLRQKMEFISESIRATTPPSDEALNAFYRDHADRYQIPLEVSFQQQFFNASYTRQELEQAIASDQFPPNDPNLLNPEYTAMNIVEINKLFGQAFGSELLAADLAASMHIIQSGLGWHIVTQLTRTEATSPTYTEVKTQVLRDWQYAQQAEFRATMNTALLADYQIIVEPVQ